MTDCIIVGGGLIGMLSARELRKQGMDVLVIDKGRLGQESSWAGGGILSPLHPWRYGEEVNELANEGHRDYPELAQELLLESGIDPEYQRCGLLVVDSDESDQAKAWAQQWNMSLQMLNSAPEIQSVLPGVSDQFESGLWMPEIGQLRNPRLVKSVRGSLQALGVRVLENSEVERLDVVNQQIKGVVAQGKTYHSERVLIAGGAWTAKLLKDTGSVPDIEPVKGQMILFRGQPGQLSGMVLCESRYLIPRRDGRILCGSTIEHVGFEKSTPQETREALREVAISLLPSLAALDIEHHWAGLRPGSPQGVPYIGPHNTIHGLFINAGHYRNGVILGLASARRVARHILA